MRQCSNRDQMTQKLTTIGHHMAINEQNPYPIVSNKRSRNSPSKMIALYIYNTLFPAKLFSIYHVYVDVPHGCMNPLQF